MPVSEDIFVKIESLISNKCPFDENSLKTLEKNNREFLRSLEVMEILEKNSVSESHRIEKMIRLFKEVVGIELLIRYNEKSANEEFSTRMSWLLATTEQQLVHIQKLLGTIYSLRSYIVHSLEIPKNNDNFDDFFNSDLDRAILIANQFHRLALLRLFVKKNNILKKRILVDKLRDAKLKLFLDIPESFYQERISDEIEKITGFKSKVDDRLKITLPEEDEIFYWGINTYGGFILPTHTTTGNEKFFYENMVNIIPEFEIWLDLIKDIKVQIRKFLEDNLRNVKIISKTHHSVLFYIGYRLYKSSNIEVSIDFEGKLTAMKPINDRVCFDDYWEIEKSNVKNDDSEIILVLNVTDFITTKVERNLHSLNLSKLSKIILNCYCDDLRTGPNCLCFSDADKIKAVVRALDLYLTQNENLRSVEQIHLFSESRGVMMMLLGMHLRLQKKEVILYEYERRSSLDEKKQYYKVIECKYKNAKS
ncbi:hypothetical protein ES708_18548 [subsurface metagenome]